MANSQSSVLKVILEELEQEGAVTLDLPSFVELLEDKVGSIQSTQGLKRLFSFITADPDRSEATIEDLKRVKHEMGLAIGEADLQKLVNFLTSTYNQKNTFSFEEFEDYVQRTTKRTKKTGATTSSKRR